MLFAALCLDKPDHVDLRLSTRAAHLAFLDAHAAQVKLGGPFLDAAGEKPVGSLLILDCENEAAARALLAQDPYAQAGLFAQVDLRPWKRVVGAQI
ncbi:YciI family protein [Methylocystis sp. 9N]|uniref:YciI family protein n=1 Tax=Methylocystis borbori TaxID=3118750 RepID=A0ABU7XGA2_9HYPH